MASAEDGRPLAAINTQISNAGLKRSMQPRHIIMYALSGSIGAGLFVGSGQALSGGGPGSMVIEFMIVGFSVGLVMNCLGEMATSWPAPGAFYEYARRFIGEPWGFTMGWCFVQNWLIILPFELVTVIAQTALWLPTPDLGIQAGIILGLLTILSLIGWKGAGAFGEAETYLGLCKICCISAFICFSIAVAGVGIPSDSRGALRDTYWQDPGPFKNGLQGFLLGFRVAGMAFGGTETLALTAAECERPHKTMPIATWFVFFRIATFYGLALIMLGFLVPSNSPDLAVAGHGAKYSPFVLAAKLANCMTLGHFINAMIICALVAMANTAVYSSTRALHALCDQGMGPKWLSKVHIGSGVPRNALWVAVGFGLISLVILCPNGDVVFDWLLSISGVNNYFTWLTICFSHIRMRKAFKKQNRNAKEELIWCVSIGEVGSWVGIVINILGLLTMFINAFWPIDGIYRAEAIIRDLIGIFFILAVYIGYIVVQKYRGKLPKIFTPLREIDLDTGRRTKEEVRLADAQANAQNAAMLEEMGYNPEWPLLRKMVFEIERVVPQLRRRREAKVKDDRQRNSTASAGSEESKIDDRSPEELQVLQVETSAIGKAM
jgi:yeast amino acid transporter